MKKEFLKLSCLFMAVLALTTACETSKVGQARVPITEEITIKEVSKEDTSTDTATTEESKLTQETDIQEVLDEHYDAFVGDVYSYPKDYENLKYRLRATYRQVEHEGSLKDYLFKGTDERWMGFEIESSQALPSPGSLILVVGTFKTKMDEGQVTPYLALESIEVIKEK